MCRTWRHTRQGAPILNEVELVCLRAARTRKLADEWALVLASQGLKSHISRDPSGFCIVVADPDRERAEAALAAYDRENQSTTPAAPVQPAPAPDFATSGLIFAALLAFFAITGPRNFDVVWFERGSASADRILSGELWRSVTALTLHADLGHVIGNAAAGTIFVGAVFGALGYGVGGAVVLAAGTIGNFANAHFHETAHTSVGASTAVFGAVGVLASLGVARHWRHGARGRRALAPIAAGLGLLAMLGTGARSDLSGHLFGLLFGILLGLPAARLSASSGARFFQPTIAIAAIVFVLSCWATALQGAATPL